MSANDPIADIALAIRRDAPASAPETNGVLRCLLAAVVAFVLRGTSVSPYVANDGGQRP